MAKQPLNTGGRLPSTTTPTGAWGVLKHAVLQVPAVKYAMGVAGIGAALAIVESLVTDMRVAVVGILAMLFVMVILFVFAKLTAMSSKDIRSAMLTLLWFAMALCIATSSLLFTSVFFEWPIRLKHWIEKQPPTVERRPIGPERAPDVRREMERMVRLANRLANHSADRGLLSDVIDKYLDDGDYQTWLELRAIRVAVEGENKELFQEMAIPMNHLLLMNYDLYQRLHDIASRRRQLCTRLELISNPSIFDHHPISDNGRLKSISNEFRELSYSLSNINRELANTILGVSDLPRYLDEPSVESAAINWSRPSFVVGSGFGEVPGQIVVRISQRRGSEMGAATTSSAPLESRVALSLGSIVSWSHCQVAFSPIPEDLDALVSIRRRLECDAATKTRADVDIEYILVTVDGGKVSFRGD